MLNERDFRIEWIQLLNVLDAIDRNLERQSEVLALDEPDKMERLQRKSEDLLEEACVLRQCCEIPDAFADILAPFAHEVIERSEKIKARMFLNLRSATGIQTDLRSKIRSIHIGRTKVLRGYFTQQPSEYGYYIDKRVGGK